jgi:hypothetical protein
MSLDGTSNTFIPYTINGINPVTGSINTTNFVKYSGNTSNTDLDGFDLTTAGTISAQNFAIPDNNSNDESWITYTVSTFGNLSTIGGLITTDLTNGRSMYFTGGVLGAPNFQFATLGNGGKVVATDANGVFSTTINAGQLSYITGLTSQAGGVGQQNTWTDIQFHTANVSTTGSAKFIQPYNALTADISTLVNRATLDSAIAGLGAGILNLDNIWGYANTNNLNGGIKTIQNATQFNPSLDANSYFVTGVFPTTYVFSTNWIVNPVSGTTANIALDPAVFYFDTSHKYIISFTGIFGTSASWVGTVFNNSTSLTVSDASIAITTSSQNLSITFTAGSSNPTIYLRFVGASGTLRWTNFTIKEVDVEIMGNLALSSDIGSNIIQSNGRTATLANGLKVNQTSLATATSLTTASLPTGVSASTLSGSYTLTATAGGTTFGMWLGSSFTFIAGAKYTFTFTGFSTNATATQAMILYTNTYSGGSGTFIGDYIVNVPITSSTVSGFFTATSNNNVVWNFVSSASGRSISFTGFTLTRADTEITGIATQTYSATGADTTTLVNRATLDSAISATNILNLNNTFTGTNLFNSTLSTSQFSDVSLGGITTITAVPFTTGQLQTAGISSQANSPGTITFGVPATLTPSPTTAPFASCYSISQLFPTTNARYECRFTGFTSPIFGVSLTIYRANVANTARIAISATVPVVVGTFTLGFLPNSNPSFVGQVFLEFSGTANKTMGWTSFTYRQGIETIAGDLTVSGATTTGSVTINSGTGGALTKLGSTAGYSATLAGGNATTSPYLEFYAGGSRRFFMGDATTTEMKFQCENNAQLTLATQGTTRMTIKTTGDMTHTAGDSSYMNYGPNASWSSNLFVGATPTRITSASTAQVITTNGNLHADAGYGRDMYYGFYANSNGTPNAHLFYGTNITFASGLPQQDTTAIAPICFNGSRLYRSANIHNIIYSNNSVGWSGGINTTYAFYRTNGYVATMIHGKCSYFVGGATMAYPNLRVYSQNTGQYWYYDLRNFTNNGSNHTTFPFQVIFNSNNTTAVGWFDVYFYSGGNLYTDSNDQLWILADTGMSSQFV